MRQGNWRKQKDSYTVQPLYIANAIYLKPSESLTLDLGLYLTEKNTSDRALDFCFYLVGAPKNIFTVVFTVLDIRTTILFLPPRKGWPIFL